MGPKIPYLGILVLEFQKTVVIFEISTLEFVKNEYLFHTVNFVSCSVFKVHIRVRVRFINYANFYQ